MNTPSTIDVLNGAPIGGPSAPYRKEQEEKLLQEAATKKESYRSLLRSGVWTVEFEKVDGSMSVMECTLDPRHLPPGDPQDSGSKAADNPTVLRVYATDREGWRSFKVLNVKKFYRQPDTL
jgi:hypothetical protein